MPGSEELERKEGPSTQESTHSTFNSNNTRSTEKEEAVVVEPPRNAVQRQLEQILRNSGKLGRSWISSFFVEVKELDIECECSMASKVYAS